MANETQEARDADEILPPTGLSPRVKSSFARVARPEFDLEQAIAEVDYRLATTPKVRKAAIALTMPSDWRKFGEVFYLENKGAERCAPLAGIVYTDGPHKEIVQHEDGEFTVMFYGKMASRTMREEIHVIGGRSSGDKFFDKFETFPDPDNPEGPPKKVRLKVPLEDVEKSAFANFQNRGISSALGIRGLTADDLRSLGFTGVDNVKSVDFQRGSKGGGDPSGVCPGGTDKDKPWAQCSPETIKFWSGRFREELKDPSKQKWHEGTKRKLAAVEADIKRRQDAAAQEKTSGGDAADASADGDGGSKPRKG